MIVSIASGYNTHTGDIHTVHNPSSFSNYDSTTSGLIQPLAELQQHRQPTSFGGYSHE